MDTEQKTNKKRFQGVVVSRAMNKTAVVLVERYMKHPKYDKYIKRSKRYKAHDEGNHTKVGDIVMIESCAPKSKDKHFVVLNNTVPAEK